MDHDRIPWSRIQDYLRTPPTRTFTRSFSNSFNRSSIHLFVNSPILSHVDSSIKTFIKLLIHFFIRKLAYSVIHWSFKQSHLFTRSFIHSFIHSFIQTFIHYSAPSVVASSVSNPILIRNLSKDNFLILRLKLTAKWRIFDVIKLKFESRIMKSDVTSSKVTWLTSPTKAFRSLLVCLEFHFISVSESGFLHLACVSGEIFFR